MPEVKLCWNPTILNLKNKGIGYVIPSCRDAPRVAGHIGDIGNGEICINVDERYDVPTGDCADRVVEYLNEAVGYVSRLNTIEDMRFLPEKGDDRKERSHEGPSKNEAEYEEFFKTLVDISKTINVTRIDGRFGNCVGLGMSSGFVFAYDPGYGRAVYACEDMEVFFNNRSAIRGNDDVLVFYRDMKGKNWENELLELAN